VFLDLSRSPPALVYGLDQRLKWLGVFFFRKDSLHVFSLLQPYERFSLNHIKLF